MTFGRRVLAAALAAALAACGAPERDGGSTTAPGPARRVPIPEPVLDHLKPAVRDDLVRARAELERLAALPDTPPDELARAYRDLGKRYQVNELGAPARACYRNAEALDPGDFDTVYYLGVALQADGELDGAVEAYRRALELRGDYGPALLRLGEVWIQKNEPDKARPYFDRAASESAYAPAARYGLGRVEAALRNHERAVEQFEAALESQPDATKVHYALGLSYRALGRRDEAEAHMRAYGLADVAFPDPVLGRLREAASGASASLRVANQALVRGQYDRAASEYRKVIEVEPDDVEARRSLGLSLWKQGDVDGAIEQYRVAVELDPDDPQNPYSLGFLLLERGDFAEAVPQLEATVELDPQFVAARLGLARALEGGGRLEAALARYREALELDPRSTPAMFGEVSVLRRLGRLEQAAARLRSVLADDPGDVQALIALASVVSESGRPEEAVRMLRQARDLEPDAATLALVHHNLGVEHARQGDAEPALDNFRRALELDPSMTDTRFQMAALLARRGAYAEAAGQYARILRDEPRHLGARLAHATALVLMERYGEARDTLEQGLADLPGQPDLAHALAKLLATCPDPAVRDGPRALALALEVYAGRKSLEHAETVAMAYAEAGRFDEAVRWQRELVATVESQDRPTLLDQLRRNLHRYENGEPCRAPWAGPAGS